MWACLLKMALLSFELHWCFITLYLVPEAPLKTLFSVDGCRIIVAVEDMNGDLLFHHLADVTPRTLFFRSIFCTHTCVQYLNQWFSNFSMYQN